MIPDTIIMRERFAGQSLIDELLKRQAVTAPRTLLARVFGLSPLDADSALWFRSAQGEIAVGRALAALPPGWVVFHALPLGAKGVDIDHLVIGPGGVFTVSTRAHRGESVWVGARSVLVGGKEQAYIPAAEVEAEQVTRLLRARMPLVPPARPVVALVDTRAITIRERPRHVWVADPGTLCQRLVDAPIVLSVPEVQELVAYIDRPAMWSSLVSATPHDAIDRFLALGREVRVANSRRTAWLTLAPLATLGALLLTAVTAAENVRL